MLGELQNVIVLAAPFFVCKGCVGMRIRRFEAVVNRHSTDLSYDKQRFLYMKYLVFVVNCFQICIIVL